MQNPRQLLEYLLIPNSLNQYWSYAVVIVSVLLFQHQSVGFLFYLESVVKQDMKSSYLVFFSVFLFAVLSLSSLSLRFKGWWYLSLVSQRLLPWSLKTHFLVVVYEVLTTWVLPWIPDILFLKDVISESCFSEILLAHRLKIQTTVHYRHHAHTSD